MTPSSDLKERLLRTAAKTPSATRQEGKRLALALYGGAALGMLAIFLLAGGLAHSASRPLGVTLRIAAGAVFVAATATLVAFGRGRSMIGRPAPALAILVAACPLAVFAALVVWHGAYDEAFDRVGFRCFGLTAAMSLLLLGAALWVRRGTAPLHAALRGAALAAASAAWATVLVDLWCPITNARHVLVGHVAPVVILVAVGAIAGQVVLRLRARD